MSNQGGGGGSKATNDGLIRWALNKVFGEFFPWWPVIFFVVHEKTSFFLFSNTFFAGLHGSNGQR
jgi:hypothetical protein